MRALWKRRDGVPPMISDDGRSMRDTTAAPAASASHGYKAVFRLIEYPATHPATAPGS